MPGRSQKDHYVPVELERWTQKYPPLSALPYTDEQMEPVEYSVDLPPSTATVLNLASKTLGVGSAGCGPLPQYLVNSDASSFSYGLRLLPANAPDVAAIARTVAPLDWPWPVLATRDAKGLITLDANGDALSYSVAGAAFQSFTAPFALPQGGVIRAKSTSKGGQSLESAVPLDPFVDRRAWTATASSFQCGKGELRHLTDADPGTFWHSQYTPERPTFPHSITIDMKTPLAIKAVLITPRPDGANDRLRDFDLYMGNDAGSFGAPVLSGTARDDSTVQNLELKAP